MNYKPKTDYGKAMIDALRRAKMDDPIPGLQYALTGKKGDKCIMNGNSWKDSIIKNNTKL